jgi:predicted alpha/beta superfamily hydrolase
MLCAGTAVLGDAMRLRPILQPCLATLVLALPAVCHSQDPEGGRQIAIGERYEIHSEAIGETRGYFVHRPQDYDLGTARYPLLIVLDGEWDFQHASTTVDFLADDSQIPAMLVVGIPNTDRTRDLIPLGADAAENGAQNFLEFITTELIPKLDRDFRTQPYRVFVGHSNGGLFGLYCLVGAPGVFKGFVLASPTLGDGDPELLRAAGSFLEARQDVAASVYLTLADETDLLSGSLELSSHLQRQAERDVGWSFAFRQYPDENHGTILLRSLYDGLKFVFEGWQAPDAFALYERGGIAAIEEHYAALSSRFGFDVPAPAQVLLAPAFSLYGQKRIDESERVILHTLELYPNDTNALLTAGRLYFDKGESRKAVEYLTKALLISPTRRAIGVDYAALNLDPNDVVRGVELSAADLQTYVGTYGSSTPALAIVLRGSRLVAVTADRDNELTALADGRFYYTRGGEVITFRRNDGGRVVGLWLQNRGVELARLN